MRTATLARKTAETDIALTLNLDGTGVADIQTGCGFLDHMLTHIAVHGLFDLEVDLFVHKASRLEIAPSSGGDEAFHDQALSPASTLRQPPLRENKIQSLFDHGLSYHTPDPPRLFAFSDPH